MKNSDFSVACPETVAVVRRLISDDGLTAKQVGDRLGVSRNAVISFCHRAKPCIVFPYSSHRRRGTRRQLTAKPAASLSTHVMRIRHTIRTQRCYPNDPRYTFACPVCSAQPTFACFTVSPDGRRTGLRPHAERVELNRRNNVSTQAPPDEAPLSPRRRYCARCTWFGCSNEPIGLGKPYCREHHERSGALLPVRNVYIGRQW